MVPSAFTRAVPLAGGTVTIRLLRLKVPDSDESLLNTAMSIASFGLVSYIFMN